jgi:hypothetical protein
MGFEPTNGSLGSYCLTTWLHPHLTKCIIARGHIDVKAWSISGDYPQIKA